MQVCNEPASIFIKKFSMKLIPESVAEIHTINPTHVLDMQKEAHETQKYLGVLKLKPGQTLFQLDIKTGEIKPAPIEYSDYIIGKKASKKLIANHHCIYLPALNLKNFIKKLRTKKYIE